MAGEFVGSWDQYKGLKAIVSQGNVYGGTAQIAAEEGPDWWHDKNEREGMTSDEESDAIETEESRTLGEASQNKSLEFDSNKHPRGHEGNPGEFAAAGMAAAVSDKPDAPKKPEAPRRQREGQVYVHLPEPRMEADVDTPTVKHREISDDAIQSATKLGSGANETHIVDTGDGKRGVWKPVKGEKVGLRSNVPDKTQYKREVAASAVAKAIGLKDLVPETTFAGHGEDEGSLQHFSENGVTANNCFGSAKFNGPKDLRRAVCFDILIGNTDRHSGNWLVTHGNYDATTKRPHKLVLIDHGLAFPTEHGRFKSVLFNQAAIGGKEFIPEDVLRWDGKKIDKALISSGIEASARKNVLQRLAELKKSVGKTFAECKKNKVFKNMDDGESKDWVEAKPAANKSLTAETPMTVNFVGHDGQRQLNFGYLSFDGRVIHSVVGPDGSTLLFENIRNEPVYVRRNGNLVEVTAKDDPAAFMRGLADHYKSWGLMACERENTSQEKSLKAFSQSENRDDNGKWTSGQNRGENGDWTGGHPRFSGKSPSKIAKIVSSEANRGSRRGGGTFSQADPADDETLGHLHNDAADAHEFASRSTEGEIKNGHVASEAMHRELSNKYRSRDDASMEHHRRNNRALEKSLTFLITRTWDSQFKSGWITLKPGGEGSESYVHVKVDDDGKIEAGPAGLADKGISNLSDFSKKPNELRPKETKRTAKQNTAHMASMNADDASEASHRTSGKSPKDIKADHERAATAHRDAAGLQEANGEKGQAEYHQRMATIHSAHSPVEIPKLVQNQSHDQQIEQVGRQSKKEARREELEKLAKTGLTTGPQIEELRKLRKEAKVTPVTTTKKPGIPGEQQSLLDDRPGVKEHSSTS